MGLISARGHLIEPRVFERLLERHLPYLHLEEAKLPCHVLAADLLEGVEIRIASGAATRALLASAAIPGVFPPVRIDGRYLIDGGVANDTPISAAVALEARRLIVLPTGYSCARKAPPRGALGAALQGLNILIVGKLVSAVRRYASEAEIIVVPPLCPLDVSPIDFQCSGELIDRAAEQTERWLEEGVELVDGVPHQLPPHSHRGDGDPYAARWV
jgi:NTE family protein